MNKYSYVIYILVLSPPYSCTFSSFLHLATCTSLPRAFSTCSMAPSSTSSTSCSPAFTLYSFPLLHRLTILLLFLLICLHLLLSFSSVSSSSFSVPTGWHICAFIVWADGKTSGVLLKYHDEWKSWYDLHIHLWWNEGSLGLRRKWPAVLFGDWNVTWEYYPTAFPFKLYYNYALCRDLSIFIKYAARCITKSRKARSVHISLKRHILHVWILPS